MSRYRYRPDPVGAVQWWTVRVLFVACLLVAGPLAVFGGGYLLGKLVEAFT